ncbi:GLPGLI family protein [Asinibacterium sp. OR53]|uniref:GLPGLI family protein n=1 Tax=Asinibacterium sp. OR53 TaxID=925409 RepID=UPI0004B2A348|nr:GLPGLI family protein [Asinibacterium sp. OR53]
MKKTLLLALIFVTSIAYTHAQTQFIQSGKIEFEKKLNLQKEIEIAYPWFENMKDKFPKFVTSYSNLSFRDGKTLYEKGKDSDTKVPFWFDDKNTEDVIYSDLEHGTFVKKQTVFDSKFLLSDSIRKINWRIFNETRDIAGFECRKAAGIIMDSVYVIAFYTDQIPVSGGPLCFTNLPGMILGIAIPRLNITIMATKLELETPKTDKLVPPPPGRLKKTDYKNFLSTLQKAMGDWGKGGQRNLVNFML